VNDKPVTELSVIDATKNEVEKVQLDPKVFDVEVKEHLFHKLVVYQMAKRRKGTASTKTRSMVAGGGAKPWRQKGTGRARASTIRSPLWRTGGITFGPQPRDFSINVPKKVRKLALRSALTQKVRENQLVVVDQISLDEPKTKKALEFLKGIGVTGKSLIIVDEPQANLTLSVRNLPKVNVLPVAGLNVYDILNHQVVICTRSTIKKIEERLS